MSEAKNSREYRIMRNLYGLVLICFFGFFITNIYIKQWWLLHLAFDLGLLLFVFSIVIFVYGCKWRSAWMKIVSALVVLFLLLFPALTMAVLWAFSHISY